MRYLISTMVLWLILWPGIAMADCTYQTITLDGKTIYCITCCLENSCSTTCNK